jgi:two-component system, cell cycle response regulator
MNEELLGRIKQCPNLPSLPAIAVQVVDLAQRPTMDISEIARIISKDPALSSKILRTVNSNFYGRSHAVSTINHALVVLGLQSVKTLVLTFSLTTNLTKDSGKGFKHLNYWRRSIYAATAAKIIAAKVNLVQQEEAFLATLLSDIGMLVLEAVLSGEYSEVCAKAATHQELLKAEIECLGTTHAEVGTVLAEQWKLPPVLVSPIAFSHNPEGAPDAALRKMAEVVELAGFCGDVFVDPEAAGAIAAVRKTCADRYKLSEAEADAMLNEIGARTKEVAGLFEINIGTQATYEAILEKSRDLLAELNIQQSIQHQQQKSELQSQNQQLQQKATTDGLTGLSNRARFDEFLRERFADRAASLPLTLLMMDLDKFKSVNDKYGHQAGDAVLSAVAAELRQAAKRPQDLAARYGGEEMVLVLSGTSRQKAAVIADTVRRAIGAKKIKCGNTVLSVTVSIGVATAEPGGLLSTPAHLVKAADMAVYAAKHGGRNCVKVFALKPPAAGAAA